jgi:hypothetical protein
LTSPPSPGASDPSAHHPAPTPAGPSASQPRAADGRVIPDLPVDLSALRLFDADLSFEVGELRQGGTAWRQVAGAS